MTNKEKGLLMRNAERAYAQGKSVKDFISGLRRGGCEHADSTIRRYYKVASERVEEARLRDKAKEVSNE